MKKIIVNFDGKKPIFSEIEPVPGSFVLFGLNSPDGIITYLLELNNETKPKIFFSNKTGMYLLSCQYNKYDKDIEIYTLGQGNFPYTITRYYEALESFDLFKGKQITPAKKNYELSKYLHYTFGIEYETSQGYVPEDDCFKYGLIPLRDGSISGIEYSTVVMEGEKGLGLIENQINTLKAHTYFNKECSLHMHLGGYPLEPMAIWALYRVCYYLQEEMQGFLPKYTYRTSEYKKSGKDYCKKLLNYVNFKDLYENIAGQKFFGSLTQPHPNDCDRNHKWDCRSRYSCVNFVNLLCYDQCKTVEFRFLRPTLNFKKIYFWLAIFNAILGYSKNVFERSDKTEKGIESIIFDDNTSIPEVLYTAYPKEFADKVIAFTDMMYIAVDNQTANEDYYGKDTELEDKLINKIIL